jgi:hypothetical protein
MSEDTKRLEAKVQAAVDSDPSAIAERVRALTLEALAHGRLDAGQIKEIMAAVMRGAQQGIERPDGERAAAVGEAVKGLDQALAAAAQATRLAVEEALGRSGEFSRETLKARLDELGGLESSFLDTLAEAAKSATGHVRTTLSELAAHGRASGTAVGGQVREAAGELGRALTELAREQVDGGVRTLRNEAGLFAGLAAGMLRGIADRLQPGAGGAKGTDGDRGG